MKLRTGAEYLQALRDGREVYLDGKRVEDVTTEPGLSTVGHTVARMYDLVREHPEALTYRDDEGRRVSGTWLQPRDRAQLSWRAIVASQAAASRGTVPPRRTRSAATKTCCDASSASCRLRRIEPQIARTWSPCSK